MPWLKSSDKLAQHPLVLAVRRVTGADERSVNEVTGFVTRCATSSAGYMTDYFITLEVAELYGLGRTRLLLRQAVAAGLLVAEGAGRQRRWRIVEDDDLFHIRAREDVEWERRRDQDRRNPELTAPVLARDGDQCRYCRVVTTSAKDTRSGRGRTFDHTEPGKPASVETYVVCCRTCNSRLKNRPRPVVELPLLPPPPLPYFSPATTSRKEVEDFFGRPVPSANTAHRDPAASSATPTAPAGGAAAAGATTGPRTAAEGATSTTPTGTAATGADPTTVEPPWSEAGSRDGSGRDGPGQVGAGAAPPSPALPGPPPARSRGSRGRRGGGGR